MLVAQGLILQQLKAAYASRFRARTCRDHVGGRERAQALALRACGSFGGSCVSALKLL
jgi:hypothetical protein